MSNEEDIALIIRYTREIETILKDKLEAKGTGLHSQVTSISWTLPDQLINKIRYLASVRNDAMHNHSAEVDIQSFKKVATIAIKELKRIKKIPLSSYELKRNKESAKYNKRIKTINSNNQEYNSFQETRSSNNFLNWTLLLSLLAGVSWIFYDYQNYSAKDIDKTIEVIRKPIKELDLNTFIETKEKAYIKKKIDSNIIIIENNNVYYR